MLNQKQTLHNFYCVLGVAFNKAFIVYVYVLWIVCQCVIAPGYDTVYCNQSTILICNVTFHLLQYVTTFHEKKMKK